MASYQEGSDMPKVSRESASQANDYGPISERREDVEGTAIQFLTSHADLDATPFMKGLPDDRCSSPHWVPIQSGRRTQRRQRNDQQECAGADGRRAAKHLAPLAIHTAPTGSSTNGYVLTLAGNGSQREPGARRQGERALRQGGSHGVA